ncbi:MULTISPECIES: EF-hand domain-containing protein [unclassified Sinorhizobium]|uniref:EF-hand domain-containing protein n=1 Tax=unclassified Sinorhizobium TaxID=2613772 RepID=UPI0024C2FD89|nr:MULTISPECIES: EF-hand domain-containing protein [unclassified Sinorhizobium]MDK1378381.1 EF-hand domain-containing protein [Sinorhizobium sp. 6-70]MDK1482698.1 EF-hand domain-containing protein [Sinorhizobium sp. 6-117]
MKRIVLLATFAFSQAIAVAAQGQPAAMNQGQMDRLDRNRNGAVDQSEYQAFMTSAFVSLDKNKDGGLRSEEVGQILNTQQFAATDANRDGKLTQNEFLNRVMADFKAADRSGDGNLQ